MISFIFLVLIVWIIFLIGSDDIGDKIIAFVLLALLAWAGPLEAPK